MLFQQKESLAHSSSEKLLPRMQFGGFQSPASNHYFRCYSCAHRIVSRLQQLHPQTTRSRGGRPGSPGAVARTAPRPPPPPPGSWCTLLLHRAPHHTCVGRAWVSHLAVEQVREVTVPLEIRSEVGVAAVHEADHHEPAGAGVWSDLHTPTSPAPTPGAASARPSCHRAWPPPPPPPGAASARLARHRAWPPPPPPPGATWARPTHHHLVHHQAADTRSNPCTSCSSDCLAHHCRSNPVSLESNPQTQPT